MKKFIKTVGFIAIIAIIGVSIAACGGDPGGGGGFVAVSSITGVPTTAMAEIPLTLTGTVVPSNATNKSIVWSVVSGPAIVIGNTLAIFDNQKTVYPLGLPPQQPPVKMVMQ